MLNRLRKLFNKGLNQIGFSLERYRKSPNVTGKFEISMVLDVGANAGQFAMALRESGYKGKILSFEPLSLAHQELIETSKKDKLWKVNKRIALGSAATNLKINITKNSVSSSFLEMQRAHENAAPDSLVIGSELTDVITLDSIFSEVVNNDDKVLLKIDTQGYEKEVLLGAILSLPRIDVIQIELSLTPLYEPFESYEYFLNFFKEHDYHLWDLIPGFRNHLTGQLLQVDGIFVKNGFLLKL